MPEARPKHIRIEDLPPITMPMQPTEGGGPAPAEDASGRQPYANFRIVSKQEYGGELLFGTTWFDPGVDIGEYANGLEGERGYGPADYAFYVIRGTLHLTFSSPDGDSGHFDVGADEGVHLTRGYRYGLSNPFDEPLYLVYAMTPAEV